MSLIIFLAECGLELIPEEIREHPSIKKNLIKDKYAHQLLDNAIHHSAMKRLENHMKRGRPDIIHICLLNMLGSSLNKSGNLRIYIHTLKNQIFEVNSELRIARNYNRFKGVMVKLLINESIESDGKKLISQYRGNLNNLIDSYNSPKIILLTTKGKLIKSPQVLFSKNISRDCIAIIGGFQKGNFSEGILNLSKNKVSISNYHLDAWVAVNRIITFYEIAHNIQ